MYKIIGGDNREYGPITADQVRQWIAQNRANAQTRAKAETGGDWQPLSAFPEFAGALGGKTANPPPLPGASTAQPRTSRMAAASLVLGIAGLITCGVTALIGLILGIVAQAKISKSRGQLGGGGLAIAGIVVSVAFLVLVPIQAALILPALAKAKQKAVSITCVSNLKQISLAARLWADNHGDRLPSSFQTMTNELGTPKVLVCPQAGRLADGVTFTDFDFSKVTYELLAPGVSPDGPVMDFARCPIHGHVARTDGSVIMGTTSSRGATSSTPR